MKPRYPALEDQSGSTGPGRSGIIRDPGPARLRSGSQLGTRYARYVRSKDCNWRLISWDRGTTSQKGY
eukprot:767409-Hanusia_phi.AAC.7